MLEHRVEVSVRPGSSTLRARVVLALILCSAFAAGAEDRPVPAFSLALPGSFEQILYKGVIGNALDWVPVDPDVRTDLQRANAVLGSPTSARSLALLLGITNPVAIIPGLIWGIWSAINIKPKKPDAAWLGVAPRERIGFCARRRAMQCDLGVREWTSLAAAASDTAIGPEPKDEDLQTLAQVQ